MSLTEDIIQEGDEDAGWNDDNYWLSEIQEPVIDQAAIEASQRELRNTVADTDIEHAVLAQEAYKDPAKRDNVTSQLGREYTYHQSFSDSENAFYTDKHSNLYHVSRGTQTGRGSDTLARDLYSDVGVATGRQLLGGGFDSRVKRARTALARASRAFPNHKNVFVGHSLGGTVSRSLVNQVRGSRGVFFNPGVGVASDGLKNESQKTFRTLGDAVSVMSYLHDSGSVRKHVPKIKASGNPFAALLSPHDIEQFKLN